MPTITALTITCEDGNTVRVSQTLPNGPAGFFRSEWACTCGARGQGEGEPQELIDTVAGLFDHIEVDHAPTWARWQGISFV